VCCVVVCQRVISMVFVLCGGVPACYMYGACTQSWFGSVIGMVRVLCGGVSAYYRYHASTVWRCGCVLYVWFVYFVVV